MTSPCGCKNSDSTSTSAPAEESLTQVDTPVVCPTVVHETVCVQADVTITPRVRVGAVESKCVGDPVIEPCAGEPSPTNSCTFTVSQSICVEIPLTFYANATAEPTGIVCDTPLIGACP